MQGGLPAGSVAPELPASAAALVYTPGVLPKPGEPILAAAEKPLRVAVNGIFVDIVPGTHFTAKGSFGKPAPIAAADPLPPVAAAAIPKAASIAPAAGARGSLLGAVVGFVREIYAKVVGLFVKPTSAAAEPAPGLAAQQPAEQATALSIDGENVLVQQAYNPASMLQALKEQTGLVVDMGLPMQLIAKAAGLRQRLPTLQAQLGAVAQTVVIPRSTGQAAFGTSLLGVFGAALYMGLPTATAVGVTAAFASLYTGLRYFESTSAAVPAPVAVPLVPGAAADSAGPHVTALEATFTEPIEMSLALDPLQVVRAQVKSFKVDTETGRILPEGRAFVFGVPVSLGSVTAKIRNTAPALYDMLMPRLQTEVNELAAGNLFQGVVVTLPEVV
ncbi:MAG: hypothetical protein EOO40_03740 [Deltaproteobacteria bacterium]|nr:MAG: hypothetical protein EOO40_03740 [Deltaproteobacteria bacterium]